MIGAFTGSRNGMNQDQARLLTIEMHHLGITKLLLGDCKGSDEQAYVIAKSLGITTIGHPPLASGLRVFLAYDLEMPGEEFMQRNHTMVLQSEVTLATPDAPERLRSGTWATIRFSVKARHSTVIFTPQGGVDRLPLALQTTSLH